MLRLAIIGSGFGSYGLLPAFLAVPHCNVVAISGSKRKQHIEYCRRIGFTNLYEDWRRMLEQEKLDAIAVAVPPDAQEEILKVAIAKGLHVFAEKPLSTTLAKARELLRLAEKKKIVHGIDFLFPEIAEWKNVKQILEKRTYGKLKHLSINWDFLSFDIRNRIASWKTDPKRGGGALSFFFSHGLYSLEHFAGTITEMKSVFTYAKESRNGGEVAADLLLKFQNGITGTAHVCCNSRTLTRHQLTFECEKGVITVESRKGVVDNFRITVDNGKIVKRIPVKKDKGRKGEDERVKIVEKLAKRFVSCCRTGTQMVPSFREGLRVQELLESARRRRRVTK